MILQFVTPLSGVAAALGLVLSLVCALLRVCEWIEEHPTKCKTVGVRIGTMIAGLAPAMTIFDGLPWSACFCTVSAAGLVFFGAATSRIPKQEHHASSPARVLRGIGIAATTIAAHLVLVHHFHQSMQALSVHAVRGDIAVHDIDPEHRMRARLPGGRIDWDAYDDATIGATVTSSGQLHRYTSAQQLTAIVITWLPALWTIICTIAQSGTLPTSTSNSQPSDAGRRAMPLTSWGSKSRAD